MLKKILGRNMLNRLEKIRSVGKKMVSQSFITVNGIVTAIHNCYNIENIFTGIFSVIA